MRKSSGVRFSPGLGLGNVRQSASCVEDIDWGLVASGVLPRSKTKKINLNTQLNVRVVRPNFQMQWWPKRTTLNFKEKKRSSPI